MELTIQLSPSPHSPAIRYQWAACKAKLAQCESEKMDLEADIVHVLEPLISRLKGKYLRGGIVPKELLLDRMQKRRLQAIA